jgi:quinol monooxygenase YgiN
VWPICTSPRHQIRVRGLLGPTVHEAFPTLESRRRGSDTVLTGPVADQAALFGVLHSIESLGLEPLELHLWRAHRITHQTQAMAGALIKTVTHGFHATMTAQPGKRDELVEFFLNAATGAGPGANEDCVVLLVGRSATNSDVVYPTQGWTSKEAHERIFASDEAKAVPAGIESLLADKLQYLDEAPVGGKSGRARRP